MNMTHQEQMEVLPTNEVLTISKNDTTSPSDEEDARANRRTGSLSHQKTLRQLAFLRQRIANSTRESLDSALKAQADLIQLEDLYLDSLSQVKNDDVDEVGPHNEIEQVNQAIPSTRALGIFRRIASSMSALWTARMSQRTPTPTTFRNNIKTRNNLNFKRKSDPQICPSSSSSLFLGNELAPFRNLLSSSALSVQGIPTFDLNSLLTRFDQKIVRENSSSVISKTSLDFDDESLSSGDVLRSTRDCDHDSVICAPEIQAVRIRFTCKPVRLTIERRGKIYAEVYNVPFDTIGLNGFVISTRLIVAPNRQGTKINGIGLGVDVSNLDTNSFRHNVTTHLISLSASKKGKSLRTGIQLESPNDLTADDLEVHPPDKDNVVWINFFME